MPRQCPTTSTQDVQEYIRRQSRLCDSSVDDAYMILSGCCSDGKQSVPVPRKLASSMGLPSRKPLVIDTVTRPSSAHECRSTESKLIAKPRGILKKTQSPVVNSRPARTTESPDEWFQRIMHVKKLLPLDLCEAFLIGDATKNRLVPLSHVCKVLFDLDPESVDGADPVTEEMEEFLYQFVIECGGQMMVDIREALRALDIWQPRNTSPTRVASLKGSSDVHSKMATLESKNRKLQDLISSLQNANLRLSRELDSAKLATSPQSATDLAPPWSPTSRAPMKISSVELSPKFKATKERTFSSQSESSSSSGLQVVNLHEQELVEIASKLQFTGVQKLEQLLHEGDVDSTGFVTLKQLRRLLAGDFELDVSESRLIEICMGMTFNSNGELDYKEFVDVLMDILIYALPDIRQSGKRKSIQCLDQYLESGFPSGREDVRQLLDALCSIYNLEDDQIIQIKDLVRVFHVDLVKHHELNLPFPLKEDETIQLAYPFMQRRVLDKTSGGLVAFPELLDAILGPLSTNKAKGTKQEKRALTWEFWHNISMSLCGGHARMKKKILAQIMKIMAKVDPDKTFTISTRHFQRVFERHIDPEDMEVLAQILAVAEVSKSAPDDPESVSYLRYDVLLKMVFGAPKLHDEPFFRNNIRKKLGSEQGRLQALFKELMPQESSHNLTIQNFDDTFIVRAVKTPLTTLEMLYLFASVDSDHDGAVQVKTLQNFLARKCWKDGKQLKDETSLTTEPVETNGIELVKKLIAKCCTGYDLQQALDDLGRNTQGWISQADMVKELSKMLHELGVAGVRQRDLKTLLKNISQRDGLPVHCDAFFDALLDWGTVITSMRLPDSLVEVNKVFEKFDLERDGSIRCEDWSKAYRLICSDGQGMADWEVRALERRFPGHAQRYSTIDYARLIVFLLDFQQRQTRKKLQIRVVKHFRQRFADTVSTAKMERMFGALDADSKGYFNMADLKSYLAKEFAKDSDKEADGPNNISLLNNADALASVMHLLAGNSPKSSGQQPVVTFERFCEIPSLFSTGAHKFSGNGSSGDLVENRSSQVHPSRHELTPLNGGNQTISSLRVLEITILEITRDFVDMEGNILPTRAFRYFAFGPAAADAPSSSPLRRSSLSNSTIRSYGLSLPSRKKHQELEASNLDPLTPSRLKQSLQTHHNIDVSTHLISQFFLHIGSPSKYFLDLLHFAQWAVPLSVEIQVKARELVRQMIVKGKGGSGRGDLDRFLAQLQRRLQDSPCVRALENAQLQCVSTPLLLSKLHQLNIPLRKQELLTFLRHFGMDEDLEAVDYALFLQRLYDFDTKKY